jgi:alpha-beta hydrolase superfamily lysophospholipase
MIRRRESILIAAALAIAALATPAARAQQPAARQPTGPGERYSLYLLRGADTVVAERVTRGPGALVGAFTDPTGATVTYAAQLDDDARIVQLDISAAPRGSTPHHASFWFAGDTLLFTQAASAQAAHLHDTSAARRVPVASGALLQQNPSVAFMEQIVMRAQALSPAHAPVTVPLVFTLGPQQIAATVRWIGADSVVVGLGPTEVRAALRPNGEFAGGSIPTQGIRIARGPARMGPLTQAPPPDYSAPAGAPYTAENVTVVTPDGLRLAGTLTLPKGASAAHRVPAVVTITGSGPEDRNSESPSLPRWKPFAQIADTLGRRGIAVLRLDDRGVGGSDAGPDSPSAIASDVRAALGFLRARAEVDPRRLALLGHSEGGLVAPMVAAADSGIRAVVLMAAPAEPVRALLKFQQAFAADSMAHLTGDARAAALDQARRATDSLAAASPGFAELINRDPAPLLRSLHEPVLILQGEKDYQVPVAQAAKVAALIRANGNRDVTVTRFPDLNHLFVPEEHRGYDYAALSSLTVPSPVLGAIADWLSAHLR